MEKTAFFGLKRLVNKYFILPWDYFDI